jgi:hypothetical protein
VTDERHSGLRVRAVAHLGRRYARLLPGQTAIVDPGDPYIAELLDAKLLVPDDEPESDAEAADVGP